VGFSGNRLFPSERWGAAAEYKLSREMTVRDALSIAAAVIASLGGGAVIVFALSNWLGKVWANRLMEADKARFARDLKAMESGLAQTAEDRRRKLEGLLRYYQRQIEEFYGPLFNSVHQIFMANEVQAAILKTVRGDAAERVIDYFHETYFGPLHDTIREVMRTKLYLAEGQEVPDSFYRYLQHAGQERDQRVLWKRFGIDTSFLRGEPWPDDFYDDIEKGFETAMANHENCLAGLRA
jgi:hypothetical protein